MAIALCCRYRPGGAEDRFAIRDVHLEYRVAHAELIRAGGALVEAGAATGMYVLLATDDMGRADAFLAQEPYHRAQLFSSVERMQLQLMMPEPQPGFLDALLEDCRRTAGEVTQVPAGSGPDAAERSRVGRALRHLYFAERDAAIPPPGCQGARAVQQVGVIGAGTMGSGIAIAALDTGLPVTLVEADVQALVRGMARIRQTYASRVAAARMGREAADECLARLEATANWDALARCDLVVEAVFEDLEVKRKVFARLDRVAKPGAVLATNTSYLDLDAIAQASARPGDVVGLHFFSPAHVMRLLAVVQGRSTTPDVLATTLDFAHRLRKQPVLARNGFGFIGNRIFAAYRRQCEFMLEEGALPEQVDQALEQFGFAMGPFAVADLSGLDVAWRMRQSLAATRDPAARYVSIPDLLCEGGRLGRKSGAGYYAYDAPGSRSRGRPDAAVQALIESASAARGVRRRPIADQEIVRRALLAMVNEAGHVLAEGVARRPADVDVVLVNGYGFPRTQGGPLFWAQQLGLQPLQDELHWLAQVSGPGFTLSNPSAWLA